MKSSQLKIWVFGSVALAVCQMPSAFGCAACFGRSDSQMAKGMNMGILALLVVIVSVLAGIASFGFYIVKRTSRVASAPVREADLAETTTKA